MVSTALLRGTKRQVSRSHSRARSSGRHTAPGTHRGEAHQPYSCRVVTNGRPRTLFGQQPGTRGEAERRGRELDVREVGFQGVQPLGGLPRPEDRHGDDLLAEVAQGGGEVADVVGDAVPLGVGLALHHGDAHGAIFPPAAGKRGAGAPPRWSESGVRYIYRTESHFGCIRPSAQVGRAVVVGVGQVPVLELRTPAAAAASAEAACWVSATACCALGCCRGVDADHVRCRGGSRSDAGARGDVVEDRAVGRRQRVPGRLRLHPDGRNGHGPKPYVTLALPFCELAQSAPPLEDSRPNE